MFELLSSFKKVLASARFCFKYVKVICCFPIAPQYGLSSEVILTVRDRW